MAARGTLAILLMAALLGAPPLASSESDGRVEPATDQPEVVTLDALIDPPTRRTLVLVLVGVAFASLVGAVSLLVAGGIRAASRRGKTAESALERRTLRRARMRLGEDPIVTAIEVRSEADRRGRRQRRPSTTRGDTAAAEARSGRT
ncbi:MAG TPA: hypothetical protein VMP86_06205 [Candidatus Binatia bacterium]|nr:hypothetical protein [Candidatus Binatia bacterium]